MKLLRRYWVTFTPEPQFTPLSMGCGVTAFDRNDAIRILTKDILSNEKNLVIKNIVEDIDVSTLDQGHVIPNMGLVTERGIWFPLGYK
jgi:hypothetical protein